MSEFITEKRYYLAASREEGVGVYTVSKLYTREPSLCLRKHTHFVVGVVLGVI